MKNIDLKMELFKAKVCLSVCVLISIACFYFNSQTTRNSDIGKIEINAKEESPSPVNLIDGKRMLHHMSAIAKILHKAKIHVRGTKTGDQLRRMENLVDKVLKEYGEDTENVVKRKTVEPTSVCPETYMGSKFGYPLYYKGFEATNCTYAKPLSQLVTVVANIEDNNTDSVRILATEFAESIHNIANVTTIIATKQTFQLRNHISGNIRFINLDASKNSGENWNKLISEVKTPYVFIARDVTVLTQDARLERLVREIEMLQVPVAAGSIRYPNGHWNKGCYQSVHKNYTLRYVSGYDESLHDCLFCDYVEGPFVTSVDTFKSIPFDSFKIDSGMFEDWFLQLNKQGKEIVVCPDSMFHVREDMNKSGELTWKPIMDKWGLYKVMSPGRRTIISDCSNIGYWKSQRAVNPCRLNKNSYPVKIIMEACVRENIICELTDGTLLGGVKFGKVLPWEKDADIIFLRTNQSAFVRLLDGFRSKHHLTITSNNKMFKSYVVRYGPWAVEAWNMKTLDSEIMLSSGKTPTNVFFDGLWSWAPRNPGLHTRNRYGPEIYKHAVHWMTTEEKDSWQPYKVGRFKPCDDPERHDCLDHYNGDGDLQFLDPLP